MLDQPTESLNLATQPIDRDKRPIRKGLVSNSRGLTQAYEIRDVAAAHAIELRDVPCHDLADKALRARALKDNSCVWQIATNRIREMRGRPLPGSLRPEPRKPKRVSPRAIPSEDPPTLSESGQT